MKRFILVILVVVACGLALTFGGIALLHHRMAQKPSPSLEPSAFLNYCGSNVLSVGFPTSFMTAGPSGATTSANYNTATGGTAEIDQYGTWASTPDEAEAMMRAFCQKLQKAAEEKGCRVENAAKLPATGPVESFEFTYTCKGNRGELAVTRTIRTEQNLQVPGKQVYTVKLVATEKVAKWPEP